MEKTKATDVNETRPFSITRDKKERRLSTQTIDDKKVQSTFFYLGYAKTAAILLAHSLCLGNATLLFAAHLEIYNRDDLRRVFNFEFVPTVLGLLCLGLLCIPILIHMYGVEMLFDYKLSGKQSRYSEPQKETIFTRFYLRTIGPDGVLGRRGPLYDSVLLCMAFIEFPIHTYQGYLVSNTVIFPGYALLYGSLIALDSFMYPVLLYVYQDIKKAVKPTRTEARLMSLKRRNAILILDSVQDLILAVIVPMFLIKNSIFQLGATGPWMSKPKLLSVEYSIAKQVGIFSMQDAFVTILPIVTAHFHLRTILNNWIDIKIISDNEKAAAEAQRKVSSSRLLSSFFGKTGNASHRANSKIQLLGSVLSLGYGCIVAYVAIYAVISTNSESACQDMLVSERFCYEKIASWDIFSNKCNCFHININCHGLEKNYTVALNDGEEPRLFDMYNSEDRGSILNATLATDFNPRAARIFEAHECDVSAEPTALVEYRHLVVLRLMSYGVESNAKLHLEEKLDLVSVSYNERNPEQIPEWLADVPPHLASVEIAARNIETLPDWITERWQNLYRLNIDSTRIKDASNIFKMKNLRYLTMEGGNLELPDFIENKDFHGLFLADNNLSKIPIDQFNQMPNLVNLALSRNQIESIDPWTASYVGSIVQNAEKENLHVPVLNSDNEFPPLSLLTLWENPICDRADFAQSDACAAPCPTRSTCTYFNLRDVTCPEKCGLDDEVCRCLSEYAQELVEGRRETVLFTTEASIGRGKKKKGQEGTEINWVS